jgi:hypothetical protein
MRKKFRKLLSDLDCEFPSRAEDNRLDCPVRCINLFNNGNTECGGLASSCLCLGCHITPCLDKWNCQCLDGCGFFEPHIFYCFTDFTRQVKIGKLYTCIHIATPFGVRVHKMALWGGVLVRVPQEPCDFFIWTQENGLVQV